MLTPQDKTIAQKLIRLYRNDAEAAVRWIAKKRDQILHYAEEIPRFVAILAYVREELSGIGKVIDKISERLCQYWHTRAQIIELRMQWAANQARNYAQRRWEIYRSS